MIVTVRGFFWEEEVGSAPQGQDCLPYVQFLVVLFLIRSKGQIYVMRK